jgi:GNAT superfamily N-acetyltransferase
MHNGLRIRRYRPDDSTQVRSLSKRAMENVLGTSPKAALDHDMDAVREMHQGTKSEFLIGILGDEIISMGGFVHHEDSTVEVQKVRVDPDHQRNGYGQALLDVLERNAEQLGVQSIVLHTSEHLSAAQQFYQRNDYKETHRRQEREEELIFYEKSL